MRTQRPRIDLSTQIERILVDLCARVPELSHIHPRRVLVCLTRSRKRGAGGVFAKLVPMRFPDGSRWKTLNGHCYAFPQIPTEEGEVLYLIYIYVPRFFEQPFERRLLTLIHELYHIAPAFDGTIRRFGSRSHGNSRDKFNDNLQPLVDGYLAARPDEELLTILRKDLHVLSREATLFGRQLGLPKPVRLWRDEQ
ncbi:MAG: putative metallopeptidase [Armatimonadota bacterium]